MSTLKTHNLQSPDAGSVNIALTPNAGMVVAGVTTVTGTGTNGLLKVERASGAGLHIQAQSALGVFGTTSNHNLRLISNGNERILLSTNGNVGINENLPGQRLTVGGDIQIGFNTPNDAGRQLNFNVNRGSAGQTLANINWQWNSKFVAQIRGIAGADTTNKDDGHLAFFTSAANSLVERLRITSGGNVEINNSTGSVLGMTRTSTNTSGLCGKVVFGNTDWDSSMASVQAYQDGGNDNASLRFYTQASAGGGELERLRITKDGEVGINKSSPNAGVKLHVGGTARFDDDVSIASTKKLFTNSSQGQLTIQGGATYPGSAIKFSGGQSGTTDQGRMIFYAGTATSLEERLRIYNNGEAAFKNGI